ncbi:hydrolase [Streptomyces sp. NBRC 110611]|nr:hydrolase [Streptomyces sp. NBRC 110611]
MTTEHGSFVSLLKRAESRARALAAKGDPRAAEAHPFINEALRAAQGSYEGPACARPGCLHTATYEGRGRPPLYCSTACQGWAAQQRKGR